jgi:hypothetical protein
VKLCLFSVWLHFKGELQHFCLRSLSPTLLTENSTIVPLHTILQRDFYTVVCQNFDSPICFSCSLYKCVWSHFKPLEPGGSSTAWIRVSLNIFQVFSVRTLSAVLAIGVFCVMGAWGFLACGVCLGGFPRSSWFTTAEGPQAYSFSQVLKRTCGHVFLLLFFWHRPFQSSGLRQYFIEEYTFFFFIELFPATNLWKLSHYSKLQTFRIFLHFLSLCLYV